MVLMASCWRSGVSSEDTTRGTVIICIYNVHVVRRVYKLGTILLEVDGALKALMCIVGNFSQDTPTNYSLQRILHGEILEHCMYMYMYIHVYTYS